MKSRIIVVFFFMILLGSLVVLRAAWLQFLPNDKLKSLKARQFQTEVTLPSRRGPIVDRNGQGLAVSTAAYSLYADPSLIKAKRTVARDLANLVGMSQESIYKKIQDSKRRFTWIQRRMDYEQMQKIRSLKVRGLSFVEEWKRIYPSESLLSQVIGFLGNEGQGLEGLELQFESILKGNSQKVAVKRDARGRPLISEGLLFKENPEGHEIQLTVDSELQYQLENELEKTVKEFEAVGAMGIILDAKTSAIRAMANVPTVDLNSKRNLGALLRNRVITDFFEPGSVIKPFVVAQGLADQSLQPNSKYDCEMGEWKIGKRTVRESDSKHKYGLISVSEILAFSSNIGTGKMALRMGAENLRNGLKNFGFGERSGVDLPGEVKGVLHSLPWGEHQIATISFGQGMTATTLQVANAYAALASDGKLRKPFIVEKVTNLETGDVQVNEPEVIRNVMSAKQAEAVRMMLTAVTQPEGTGKLARVPGYQVAGKTGTAQRARDNGRGYEPGAYISSFAGMIPAHQPEYVIYVVVDRPQKAYYAGQVAAPLFSRIASFAVRRSGLAPSLLSYDDYSPVDFEGKDLARSRAAAKKSILKSEDILKSNFLLSEALQSQDEESKVPELHNLSLREAIKKIEGYDVKVKVMGQGKVMETWPKSGDPLPKQNALVIFLE